MCCFAVLYILIGVRKLAIFCGHFLCLLVSYIKICGIVTPCGALMRPLPIRCKATGSAMPFFIAHNFHLNALQMKKNQATALLGNTLQTTSDHETINLSTSEISEFSKFLQRAAEIGAQRALKKVDQEFALKRIVKYSSVGMA
jgi:hypothetical protein